MWLEIAARRIIMPFILSVILFIWGPLSVAVREYNLRTSEGCFIGLVFLCCIQLVVALIVWEVFVYYCFVRLEVRIDELGRSAVRKCNVAIALYLIRFNYLLVRVQRFLRQGWISVSGDRDGSAWKGLHSWSLRRCFVGLVKLLLSVPVCLSVVCACIMLRSTDSRIGQLYEGILYFMRGSLSLGDVFQGILSRLPAVVALMPLLSLPVFLYFYSQKRNVRRAIVRNKAAHVDEVALLFERLLLWFDRNLHCLCLHFDFVTRVQRSLVDFQLKHIFPERVSGLQAHRLFMGVDELDRYMFVELGDVQELSGIVDELLNDRLKLYTRFFSATSDDVWELYSNDLYKLKTVEGVQEVFLCKDAVKSLVGDRISREQMRGLGVDRVSEVRDELEDWLSFEIYSGLETLYRINKASQALRRYLYSSRTETLILKVLIREK